MHFSQPVLVRLAVPRLQAQEPAREPRPTKMLAGSTAAARPMRRSKMTCASRLLMLVAAMRRPPVRC
ncbi:MAG: hypothetical protein WCC97_19460 [Candidatus Acidiferrales bacterium]